MTHGDKCSWKSACFTSRCRTPSAITREQDHSWPYRLLNRPQTVLIEAFSNFDISTCLYVMGKSKWMFCINGSSAWKHCLAEMYIFIVCLKQFEPQQSWSGFKLWATYIHMICSKLERLIKYELRGPQSLPGLFHGNEPALKYWLAVTKLLSLESVFTVFMTLKITSRFSETAQIKEKKQHSLAKHLLTK